MHQKKKQIKCMDTTLINLFDGWSSTTCSRRSTTTRSSTRHSTWHSSWHTSFSWSTSCSLVHFGDDWIEYLLEFLLLVFKLIFYRCLVGIEPFDAVITLVIDQFLVSVRDCTLDFLFIHGGFHLETVGFETVLSRDFLSLGLIFSFVFFCIIHHFFDIFFGQPALVIGNSDLVF